MNKMIKYLLNPLLLLAHLDAKGFVRLPDQIYIEQMYNEKMGKKLDLKMPETFTEKLQWIKLYDHNPLYTKIVDKYMAKEYIERIVGSDYVVPTIGVWDSFEDIDFSLLPKRFVLKTTHDSGGVYICKNKSESDINTVKNIINASLKRDYYRLGREWPYKDVPRKIIAEPYLEDEETKELRDYKFFCFDGTAKMLFVATGRQTNDEPFFNFFDMNYNHLSIRNGHPLANQIPEKPRSFDKMVEISELLSNGFPELRVDFYEVNGKPYVGELTLFHHCGWMPFEPEKWDYMMGKWIHLPSDDYNRK